MTEWLILIEQERDLPQGQTPHKVLTVRDYLAHPELFKGRRPSIINLSRSYSYQSNGYYASLLAEARGQRALPSVQTILELSRKALYAAALPELNESLNRAWPSELPRPDKTRQFLVIFGEAELPALKPFAALLFDWFRCPIMQVSVTANSRLVVERLQPMAINRLDEEQRDRFFESLTRYTTRRWTQPKARTPARWNLAVLHDPNEALPPSRLSSLKRLADVGERMGVSVDPIGKSDLPRLAEFDALFIRETTSIDNHTYRFARRAEQEGMPVIDDTQSMIRCTNKIFLKELMEAAQVPIPASTVLTGPKDLERAEALLGYPMVVKIPDGSFSRGVHKVNDRATLSALMQKLFDDTDLLLAQEFMPTSFDWRVGILGGEPLYASQYLMAKNHWQIIKHQENGRFVEGGFNTVAIDQAPAEVVDIAVRAARPIGDGLYGVDLKQNERGVFVIEINDNPNLDSQIEGAVLKDELWRRLLSWFIARLENR